MNKELLNKITPHIKNESTDEEHILTLSGVVAQEDIMEGDVINSSTIKKMLNNVGNKRIKIKLNSYGGDAFEGVEIYNYLKSLKNKTTVEVTSIAASAASIIAMGADEVHMANGAQMMIHEAGTLAFGTKAEIKKTLNALESMDKSIADIYHDKTGLEHSDILQLMSEETWFTSQEAVTNKFADKVIKGGDNVAKKKGRVDAKQLEKIVAMLNEGEDVDEEETVQEQIDEIIDRLEELEKRVNEDEEEESDDDDDTVENTSSRFFF